MTSRRAAQAVPSAARDRFVKVNDAVWGALFALLGAAILWHVQGFPRIPGQNVGPGLFPGVLAAAMLVCGAILIATGLKARRAGGAASRWTVAPEWLRSRRHVLAFVGAGRRATSSTCSSSTGSASCSPPSSTSPR